MNLPTELVELSAEQHSVLELCQSFASEQIRPIARAVDEADTEVCWDIWHRAAEVGLTSFMLPEEHGGGGFTDVFTQCLVQEELCAGDVAIGNLLTANGFFAHPVLELGTAEQRERYLRPLTSNKPPMTALAVTEPDVGSDAAGITTRATSNGDGYLLSGRKAWISNAGAAEHYIIFATVDPAKRSRGVTAFVVHKDAPGFSVSAPWRKMGQRALINAELTLDDVPVSTTDMLGTEGAGFAGLMQTFDRSRTILAAAATGLARAATEYAADYAAQRTQFGKPINQHQAVAFRLAEMATRVESARLLTWRAARRIDAGLPASRESAMAKLVASETAMFATWAAVQTLGGWGYSREFLAEKWMRDAKLEEIEEGTSDMQRLIISRDLVNGR
ncbi:alkylation response protein AidB-like acyl-CoA dehydrogenase [Tamaricihabitans halophyticus]|uniref:Alkylation response protein AidB-like acyl-CoA dehydrogenase n=1 Tax=Tamaricihabitans halophyticus TaxID=1262583 RepID=A0A4R2QQN2_9PSEU|nr:acyl-CoA dehydrogenase family protein [Tamaricihabitans halophyticus]TCP49335.1 alkylation response protein AidB-like acyl-CoA dehydrogenase [Tamaricihabitans halophyticus]